MIFFLFFSSKVIRQSYDFECLMISSRVYTNFYKLRQSYRKNLSKEMVIFDGPTFQKDLIFLKESIPICGSLQGKRANQRNQDNQANMQTKETTTTKQNKQTKEIRKKVWFLLPRGGLRVV